MSSFGSKKRIMRSNKRGIGPFLVLVASAAVLALILASIWQLVDNKITEADKYVSSSSSAPSANSTASKPGESSSGSDSSSSEPIPENKYSEAVVKGEWVDTPYFDDAVFFGDSLTNGIQLYDVMSNTTVISSTGITLDNVLSKAVIKDETGKYVTMMEALKAANPKKIYVMMGANSLGWDKETFIKKYDKLLEAIKEQHPDSIIYVQSILPVTAKLEEEKPTFANVKIDEYNIALMELAASKRLNFLYVAEDFKDDTGCLPAEASPKDGIHFGRTYYTKWFDYLRTHTVK